MRSETLEPEIISLDDLPRLAAALIRAHQARVHPGANQSPLPLAGIDDDTLD